MLAVAQSLKEIGHDVTFHTAETFRRQIESRGLRFIPLTGKAEYDYRDRDGDQNLTVDERKVLLVKQGLLETIPDQHQSIQQILQDRPIDLLIVDTMFFGAYPLLLGAREKRPPVLGCGLNPLWLSDSDFAYDIPSADTEKSVQEVFREDRKIHKLFNSLTGLADTILALYRLPPLTRSFLDSMYILPDVFLQFTAAAFEIPRRKMPSTFRFIGSMPPNQPAHFEEPAWWPELDSSRPVVLVTQGTLANRDLNEVVQPALSGLADEDVLVIVAVGRDNTVQLTVPANARVASFIPFSKILPKVDVLVTNGGYGAVNQAFSAGVPIVVAGETEDKNTVAARIAWTGAGINLKARYANPEKIRDAVREILANENYLEAAQRLRRGFADYDAAKELGRTVDAMIAQAGSDLAYTH
jgi:MGT family glycosyltransferase